MSACSSTTALRSLAVLLAAAALVCGALVARAPPSWAETGGPIQLAENIGKCVDRDVASGRVQLWRCNGQTNQTWRLDADREITTDGLCLSTESGGTANNTRLVVTACTGAAEQHWSHNGNSLESLGAAPAHRCLDLTAGNQGDGTWLQIYDCIGNPNQTWSLPAAANGWTAAWASSFQEGDPLVGASDFSCRNSRESPSAVPTSACGCRTSTTRHR